MTRITRQRPDHRNENQGTLILRRNPCGRSRGMVNPAHRTDLSQHLRQQLALTQHHGAHFLLYHPLIVGSREHLLARAMLPTTPGQAHTVTYLRLGGDFTTLGFFETCILLFTVVPTQPPVNYLRPFFEYSSHAQTAVFVDLMRAGTPSVLARSPVGARRRRNDPGNPKPF